MSGYSEFGTEREALSVRTGGLGFIRIGDVSVHQAVAAGVYTDWSPTIGPELITNGAMSVGADLVTNGAFAADTDWTKGDGWTIASDIAHSAGTQSADADLTQTIAAVTSTVYVVTFTVSNYSAGNVTAVVGDTEGTDRSADGTFIQEITCGAGADIDIRADADFIGDIDNVIVAVADVEWTKGTGWTLSTGVADSDASQSGNSDLTQTITPTNLDEYLCVITVANRSAGNVTPTLGDTEGTDRATNDTFTEVLTSGAGTDFDLRADATWDGDVDDVSLKLASDFAIGDARANGGADYFCIVAHYAGEDDEEPGVGANWTTYWDLVVVHTEVTEFVRLQALTACTFGGECVSAEGDNLVAADVLPIGTSIWGRFTRLDLTTGVLLAYYRK